MSDIVDEFVSLVCEKNVFQKKYLATWSLQEKEREDLGCCLRFFVEHEHNSLDYLADAYLFINNMVMEERLYFLRNGKYRNSTFESVENSVYHNPEYMNRYMCGLVISDYIWLQHIKLIRYFEENLNLLGGERYLEIGPGYGQYLMRAMESGKFQSILAVDLSETSVEKCNNYVEWRKSVWGGHYSVPYEIRQADFFDFSSEEKFDCIVMGEVLEHVEDPAKMLKKIRSLLTQNGKAYISTVINSPMIDHIYFFSSPEEVLDMAKDAGFSICESLCVAEGDATMEKARKKKMAVDIAMILEKQ